MSILFRLTGVERYKCMAHGLHVEHSLLFPSYIITRLPLLTPHITLSKMMFTAGLVALVAAPFTLAQRGGGSVLVGTSSV
jgi:hypothetical protein